MRRDQRLGRNVRMPPDDDTLEHVSVVSTIVRNCATTIRRASGGGNKRVDLDVHNSDLDLGAGAVSESGNGTLLAGPAADDFNSDPLFVGLPGVEQLLRFDSPAIDRGLAGVASADESATDLAGNPRVVRGRADGGELRDVGAYEYQRRAPTATASAGAASAEIGQRVTFTAAATDPDPGVEVQVQGPLARPRAGAGALPPRRPSRTHRGQDGSVPDRALIRASRPARRPRTRRSGRS